MATGYRAFPQQTLAALVQAIDKGEIVPPSLLNPVIPVALDRLVVAALARQPEHRFENGIELARALQALAPERRRRPRGRHPVSLSA
jgi:eukaryotic-like serine/threonine-protein kinase